MLNSITSLARSGRRWLLLLPLALALAPLAWAQADYPTKTLRIVVPYAAGGAGDAVTRIVAERLSVRLGQQVVVENRAGAGGVTGAAYAAKAAPDGYTLAFAAVGFNLFVAMQPSLQFDPSKELIPIGFICSQPYVLLARGDAPYKNVADLISHAKAHPGEVRVAHAGVGTLIHLFGTWLAADSGVTVNQIPYGGSGPAVNSLLAGQTDISFEPPSVGIPHVQAGKLRALASTGETRLAALPDVPTMKEQGHQISGATWFGLMAPVGTPAPIIVRLNQELNGVLQEPEFKKRLAAMHFEVETSTPESFGKFFKAQTAQWTKVIKDSNVKVQ